jgi:hypothetical protein
MNLATAAAAAALDAVKALCNSGTLVFYSGTQPSTPETALSGNTALVTFTFSATAFGADSFSGGNEQTTASFAATSVAPSSSGTAVVMDLTIGTSGTDIVIGSTTISTGVNVTLSSFVLKLPAS